mmetsp:Transcript_40736/g.62174  ORF Transcript_40736/g.62174 Transcript_40736/m.62174 type:complete len:244 (-) Transcript_40736:29-760(-)
MEWLDEIERTLHFEDFEPASTNFKISKCRPIWKDYIDGTIDMNLDVINSNLQKVPKIDGLDQMLSFLNSSLLVDLSGYKTDSVNSLTMQFNDLTLQQEYSEVKSLKELPLIRSILIADLFQSTGFLIVSLMHEDRSSDILFDAFIFSASLIFILLLRHASRSYIPMVSMVFSISIAISSIAHTSLKSDLNQAELFLVTLLIINISFQELRLTMGLVALVILLNFFFRFIRYTAENMDGLHLIL